MTEKKTIQSVCVYCSSSTKISPVYVEAAEKLGRLLGERGIRVVNGGGTIGLMRNISDAALKAGGSVTGVIPRFMMENRWGHSGLSELIEVDTMHERKQTMANMADAVIALPGGCGTLEELLEIITWRQLGLYEGPVIILNTNSYFDPLIEMLKRAIEEQFMHPGHALIWTVVDTPEEAVRFNVNEYQHIDKNVRMI
ncbi:TIGR00730 family Rossman fold protein [Bacteroides sp. 214]|uniref:LOG family protein n=1 Tax=Bacteroides sp. 214 TaxID=2302935 RepID=UPI0013D47A89|nr:TIGR00730 family Rossman fold protein [Bacteroides sp. 214]NDW12641.1 TIGR00730 family Rossman fold protein [Bacteroides sp. 214]